MIKRIASVVTFPVRLVQDLVYASRWALAVTPAIRIRIFGR